MEELPDLARLEREFGSPHRFQLVTVVYAWRGSALLDLPKRLGTGSLVLYADTEGFAKKLGVEGWPTKFLIRDGRVLLRRVGGGAGAYEEWRPLVERWMKRETTVQPSTSPPNNRANL